LLTVITGSVSPAVLEERPFVTGLSGFPQSASNVSGRLFWFALQVQSRREAVVAAHLEGQGFPCFLPLYESIRQWSDRKKEVKQPLFPGYLFCQFDFENRRPVVVTPGVQQIVGSRRAPLPVDESELDRIRQAISSGLLSQPWPYVQIGERVRVNHGSLKDLEGILVNFKGSHRVVLSVTLLQRSVAMEVELAWVTPVCAPKLIMPARVYTAERPQPQF
jgi:transcription antitermination factor NusG